jgi:hypothetical protein
MKVIKNFEYLAPQNIEEADVHLPNSNRGCSLLAFLLTANRILPEKEIRSFPTFACQ